MSRVAILPCPYWMRNGFKLWGQGEEESMGIMERLFNEVTDVTAALCALAVMAIPSAIDDHMDAPEHFVVVLYDRTSSQEHVNDCRKHCSPRMAGQLMLSNQLEKP